MNICYPEERSDEGSREHIVGATETLPPFGRLSDIYLILFLNQTMNHTNATSKQAIPII